MKHQLLTTLCTALWLTAPAFAQSVELVETAGDYQIMRVVASKVCYAVYNGKSADGSNVTFATYKTSDGDRWQIVGYVDDKKITTNSDLLTIQFDGQTTLIRTVDISRGDYALPFAEDNELEMFDAGIEAATKLSFNLKNLGDAITLDLAALRAACEVVLIGGD